MTIFLETICKELENQASTTSSKRPLIGISANRKDGTSCIADPYFKSVIMAGGAPLLLPVTTDICSLTAVLDSLDGLILSGGGDIDSEYLGEEPVPELGTVDAYRDKYDFLLLRLAFNRQLPVLGICRGHQIINVAFGGSLYQDIHTQYSETAIQHSQEEPRDVATHFVNLIDLPSKLRTALQNPGELKLDVNSLHHQAVKEIPSEFITTAVSPDGLNEAMEHVEYPIFSVQWHPEPMATAGNKEMLNLFRYHVEQAHLFKKAKKLHDRIVSIDSHTDTPMIFETFDLGRKEGGKVNLPLMKEGHVDAAFMVAYVPQGERDEASLQKAHEYATERLSKVLEQEKHHSECMGIARTADDMWKLKRENKKAVFLGVENGYAVGKDLQNLQRFKNLGVSYITLCHNGDNDICDSAAGNAEWGGLSPFGKEVVVEMNRLGIMIDISHAAESTFYDVLKNSNKPIIASHSSCRALCNHARNLDDEQIKTLSSQGGIISICLYEGFINKEAEKASLSDAVNHICHAVDIAGIDHVGIGSDFDGGGELIGCRAANELIQITQRLMGKGFDDEAISKIWGGNLLRIMIENGI